LNNIPKKKKKQQFQRVRKKKFQSERKKAFKTDNAGAELLVVDGGYSKKNYHTFGSLKASHRRPTTVSPPLASIRRAQHQAQRWLHS
jgi:hypothetical protein